MRTRQAFALGLCVAASLAAGGLALEAEDGLDVEVRTVPRSAPAGRLQRTLPLGQGFRPEFDGLWRIDVALVVLGGGDEQALELSLHSQRPDGPLLRRVRASEWPPDSGWGVFEFEPIEDSAGREFWWRLELPGEASNSPYSPWIRYHGQVGIQSGWGNRVLPGRVFEGRLADQNPESPRGGSYPRVPHPYLCAVSFGMDRLVPGKDPIRLELWDQGQSFEALPLRSVTLHEEAEVHGGYVFFAFEPIAQSRWRDIQYRLTLNEGARLVGNGAGPTRMTWHGLRGSDAALTGHSRGSQVSTDRSLVFRSHSRPTLAQRLQQIDRRGGWKLWIGGLCWLLAAGLFARALLVR